MFRSDVPLLLKFVPSPNFADLVNDPSRKILIRGPNRIGKSRHLAYLVSKRAVENPKHEVRFVAPTSKHAQTVFGKYVSEFVSPYLSSRSYYVDGKGWNGGRGQEILLDNGSVIQIRSLEDSTQAHSGSAQDLIVFDEPPLIGHYIENVSRLMDRSGQLIIGATMVGRPVDWLRGEVEGTDRTPDSGRTVHSTGWTQYVAALDQAHCPWYTEKQIAEFVRTLSTQKSEYRQRIEGAWEGTADDRHIHAFSDDCVVDSPPPATDYRVRISIDHGELAGHSVCVGGMYSEKRGTLYIFGSVSNRWGDAYEDDVLKISEMLQRVGVRLSDVQWGIGDINRIGRGLGEDGIAGAKINQVMEKHFAKLNNSVAPPFRIYPPDKSPGMRDWGLRSVNQAFNRRELLLHPSAVEVVQACKYWRGKERSKDYTRYVHAIDALRYLLIACISDRSEYQTLRFQ